MNTNNSPIIKPLLSSTFEIELSLSEVFSVDTGVVIARLIFLNILSFIWFTTSFLSAMII